MEGEFCYRYPRPAVTTDCVIFGFDGTCLEVLLIKRGNDPYKGSWAFPGGFLNMDETAEVGALRELEEETGMRELYVEQFHTFSAVDRDPRGRTLTVAYYALVERNRCKVKGSDDAIEARWFSVDALPALAFDHGEVFQLACKALSLRLYLQLKGIQDKEDRWECFDKDKLWNSIPDVYRKGLKTK